MYFLRLILPLLLGALFIPKSDNTPHSPTPATDTLHIDRDYALEAFMVGFFAPDGSRNPTLRANKGDRVRITITNGELMTHDISLEKLGIKSKVILEKGSKASVTFTAQQSDTYFCSIPGHRAAGMVGSFEVVEGPLGNAVAQGQVPTKNGQPLNLDFETGTLKDWTATGDAFENPVFSQDPSPVHEKDMKIGFEGKHFLSSGGTLNYKLTCTLTSVPFEVTQPFAAF